VSLIAFWSPKGGSGTSVTVAACAIHAARRRAPVRLVDLAGDQPAVLGLGADPETGVADWLAAGPAAPTDALDRLGVEVVPGLSLVPRGGPASVLEPPVAAEAGAALAVALRDGPTTFVDVGVPDAPAARALLEVADATLLVVRECYLALRRAAASSLTARAFGAVVLQEPGRALGPADVGQVLGRPVTARVPVRAAIARAVDAGVLATRLPDPLVRVAEQILRELGLASNRAAA
jgi:cellulose biosynthesis protein BcsQ